MIFDSTGRRVIVTGGSSGLGAAVVAALTEHGDIPIVLDRNPPRAEVHHEIVDLADPADATTVVADLIAAGGPVDGVVTCAGMDRPAALGDGDFADWEQIVAVNLLGTAAVIHAALPSLREQQGHIVTVASTLGHRAVDHGTAYCASKFGVVGLTRALMAELRGEVAVTLLTPGGMDTSFFEDREERFKPPTDAELLDPAVVADAVVYALTRPRGSEIRELVVTGSTEGSWP